MIKRIALLMLVSGVVSACANTPPPAYLVAQPPPYRIGQDGLRVDNDGYRMDAEGWRIDNRGRRIGVVPPSQETSNKAVGGYWIAK
jgi:hypothetical protein